MKLIYISQEPPYPPYKDGGRMIHYQYAKLLSAMLGHDFEYHYFFDPREGDHLKEVKKEIGAEIKTYPMTIGKMCFYLLLYVLHLPTPCPIRLRVPRGSAVIIDGFGLAWLGRSLGYHPVIHFPHDSFSLFFASLLANPHRSFGQKIYYGAGFVASLLVERRAAAFYDRIVVVADKDVERFGRWRDKLVVLTNGVDTDFFQPKASPNRRENSAIVVFSGVMDYPPNIEAVDWFCQEVWPIIQRQKPKSQFWIVGRSPTAAVKSWHGRHDVVVTGEVTEVQPYLQRADVFVAPMISGSGIKNKILQALAIAKPVVTTSAGRAGIGESPAVIVADEPKAFAQEIIWLIDHPKQANSLGKLGRQLVVDGYGWASRAQRLLEIASELLPNAQHRIRRS